MDVENLDKAVRLHKQIRSIEVCLEKLESAHISEYKLKLGVDLYLEDGVFDDIKPGLISVLKDHLTKLQREFRWI